MSVFNTELLTAITSGVNPEEFFRQSLELAINSHIENELTAFLNYANWSPIGYSSYNSRNGYYGSTFKTEYRDLHLKVARYRLREFAQKTLPAYEQGSTYLEQYIIHLYQKGITTREIDSVN